MKNLLPALPALRIAGAESRRFPRLFFRDLFIAGAPLGELMLYRAARKLSRTDWCDSELSRLAESVERDPRLFDGCEIYAPFDAAPVNELAEEKVPA